MTIINGVRLEQTCYACPEQYDAFLDATGERVGYLRLRHGSFTVNVPDPGGKLIYDADPEGDGIFEDHERERYLTAAVRAIRRSLGLEPLGPITKASELAQELEITPGGAPISARFGKHGQTYRISHLSTEPDGSVVIVLGGGE
jgi:hypothetical protein